MLKPVVCLFLLFSLSFHLAADDGDKDLQEGFVNIIYDADNDAVHLQLNKTQLNQEMIFQSSLPRGIGSNDIGLDRGQLGQTRLVKFVRYGNKVFLQQLNTDYRASSPNAAERLSIDEAFADSVVAGFTIANESEQHISFDYTDFLLSDMPHYMP